MSQHYPFASPHVPSARVVKEGTRRVPQPTVRNGVRAFFTLTEAGRERLALVIGLWPLLLVGGMTVALLWTAGYHSVQP